jgi:hypothetical protein
MATETNQEKEFIIPTKYKTLVSSNLSWPIGAVELTKHLADVPQIEELQLTFAPSYGAPQQGKLPVNFSVVEVRYTHPPFIGDNSWELNVYPVPRNMRAKIREALTLHGFKLIAEWLSDHAKFSGRASNLRFTGIWNSELDELNFESRDNVLPEVSSKRRNNKQ